MCGRFVGFRSLEALKKYFPIDIAAVTVTANYNVAPGQKVLAIVQKERKNRLEYFHWGLVPFWAKEKSIGNRLINARSETISQKPSFRKAFKDQRCLILSDGFYEWQKENGTKRPVFITLPDKDPFAFAGLWESWTSKESDISPYLSCTIITRPAAPSIRHIHHRMPVILKPENYLLWLDSENHEKTLLTAIIEDSVTELVSYPVSKRVNRAMHNDVSNIKPLEQMTLPFSKDNYTL